MASPVFSSNDRISHYYIAPKRSQAGGGIRGILLGRYMKVKFMHVRYWATFFMALLEALASPAIPPGPERAMGAGGPFVIDTFLMWTANDPVRHHDRLSFGVRDERKHFLRDIYIVANIPSFQEPAPEV